MPSNVSKQTNNPIPLSVPEISGREWELLKDSLDTGWVSSAGPHVTAFEEKVAAYAGAKRAVAVASGTSALHLSLLALGVKANDAVIVSDMTFVASVNAIVYTGAAPIFMDADASTWQMDVEKTERFLRKECEKRADGLFHKKSGRRVSGILPVHILGLSCRIDRIVALAKEFGIWVLEDAAEGMGVKYSGRHVGTFGNVGVFSFNGNKIITTGGGGMVVTNDNAIADRCRYLSTQAKTDEVENVHGDIGFNYRLTNIQAALGIAQMEQLPTFVKKKKHISERYDAFLKDVEGLTLMPTSPNTEATNWLYTVLLSPSSTLAQRKEVLRRLHGKGVMARPLWHPIHSQPPFRAYDAYEIEVAPRLYERSVSLPTSVGISDDDIGRSAAALKEALVLN